MEKKKELLEEELDQVSGGVLNTVEQSAAIRETKENPFVSEAPDPWKKPYPVPEPQPKPRPRPVIDKNTVI